jgi:hypothetical protein
LYNIYPPDSKKTSLVESAADMWNTRGLSRRFFLSSALIPPPNNPNTRAFTNSAYLQLLKCRTNVGKRPLQLYSGIGETSLVPLPVDRTFSSNVRAGPGKHLISGYQLDPSDIQRSVFRSLVTFIGAKSKFDAFEAIAGALYTEGKSDTSDDDPYYHPKMSLELKLNVVAFYLRCAHFPFTSPLLEYWSSLAIEEYEYAVAEDLLTSLGLSGFKGHLPSFSKDRLQWSDNFRLLAARLQGTNNTLPKPPLWMDLYALQLLFFKKARPVLFAPVYGFATKQAGGLYLAHPQVPMMESLSLIEGLPDSHSFDLPPLCTVVPLLATTISTFGCLKHPQDDTATDVALCQQLVNYTPKDHLGTAQFRTLPRLSVLQGQVGKSMTTFKPEHCASNALCMAKDKPCAMADFNRCPALHNEVRPRGPPMCTPVCVHSSSLVL